MKTLWLLVLGMALIACNQMGFPNEGFENPVAETTTVQVGQGQQCTSSHPDLRLAAKYPSRLPQGVSIQTVAPDQWLLTASADAPKNKLGLISSGTRVAVSEPTTALSLLCNSINTPI